MSETIIIEANREIAYRDEIKSLKNALTNENIPNFPNNEWITQIQSGVPLEVGDQISIEATMIQQKGTPEETIEFSGESNIKSPFGYVDNKAEMDFHFYITNRQQFNCPLPLMDMAIKRSVADASTLNYGLPDLSTFDNFKKAYPYRGIEGMVKIIFNGEVTYREVDGGGVFSRPSQSSFGSNTTRYYLMNIDGSFKSYQTSDGNVSDIPQFASSKVEVSLDTGFNTPSNVSQKITEQFHQREGEPNFETGWSIDFAPTNSYELVTNVGGNFIVAKKQPAITDKLYRTVATSTGDLLNGRFTGDWTASFTGEPAGDGGNYIEQQGINYLYKNILCGDPEHFYGAIDVMSMRKNHFNASNVPINDLNDAGVYTGHSDFINDIGQWGCNLCLIDVLDEEEVTGGGFEYVFPTSRTTTTTATSLATLKMKKEELLVTNLPYGEKSVSLLGNAMTNNKIIENGFSPSSNETSDNKYLNYTASMYFGRADDENSLGSASYKMLLPNPRVLKQYSIIDLPTSYPEINTIKTYVGFTSAFHTTRHEAKFHVYYKPSLNQTSQNKVNLTLPSNSEFSLTNSGGKYGDQTISELLGIAIIPVFYKNPPTPSLQDVPFCAVINYEGYSWNGQAEYSTKKLIPYPIQGEFFGYSPSMYDNLLSKVVTTEKAVATQELYLEGHEPYNYGAFCFIGADNPQLAYDDTSSRMSFKEFNTAVRPGNGSFQDPLEKINDQASIESMCVNEKGAFICSTDKTNAKLPYDKVPQSATPFPVISSQAGIALSNISFTGKRFNNSYIGNSLDPLKPEGFTGTMFEKLGFVAEQLIPFTGFRQNQYNRSNYNSVIGDDIDYSTKFNNMVKPFTTNAYISGADQLSFVLNVDGQNMENLGQINEIQGIYINAESDELIALNLPQKLDYPYLVVYSDIVRNTKFFGGANGQQKIPAMGYISRNYSTGDYFYSFSTGWTYTIDTPYILTDFKTQIMLPDGRPAPIEKNSSVVYKIIKRMSLPPAPLPLKNEEKEIKERTKKI